MTASSINTGGQTAIASDGRVTIAGGMSDGKLNIRNDTGAYTHFGWPTSYGGETNYIRGNTQIDGNLNINNGKLILKSDNGNSFTFELGEDTSRAHGDGQKLVIRNKYGKRVLDIYNNEVKNWKTGQGEPVTIFSRDSDWSYLNVQHGGFYAGSDQCGHYVQGHMGCNFKNAFS